MMEKIINVIAHENFQLEIVTESGVHGFFDVRPYLNGGAFKPLQNYAYFQLVRPAHRGVAWPGEQDFSSDTLLAELKSF